MKLCARIAGVIVVCAAVAYAQTSLTVGYQKTAQYPIAGATAAYSLDPLVVEASIGTIGLLQLNGKGPGSANIVIVTPAGAQTLSVVVPMPPPVYPPGFEPPLSEGAAGESGRFETRYISDPSQLTNSIEFQRSQGDSLERLQVVNANLLSANSSSSSVGFPFASYEIKRGRRDVTFIDQTVTNSPLTVDGYAVRGLHWQEGPWSFHAGFTSIAVFQGLFLTTDPEYVAGISRTFFLNKEHSLEANFFYFQNPTQQTLVSPNGGVGSFVYRYHHADRASFLAELGMNLHPALALKGNYDDKKTHLQGSFRIVPKHFAALALNNEHGIFGDLTATRDLTPRLYGSFNVSESDFNLPALNQSTFASNLSLNFRLNKNFSLSGGSAFTRFSSSVPVAASIESLNNPAGIDFSSRHFGSGFQYQRTTNFDGSGGNDYSVNVRASAGQFVAAGYFRHDVQVPTAAVIFSQLPGLQDILDRAGIVATTPDELAQLLRNSALLATLGFTVPLTLNLAPSRNDTGASLNWNSTRKIHPQVSLSYFDSDTRLITGDFRFTSVSLSYSQRLSATNDLFTSVSVLRTTSGGPSDVQPIFSVSLSHRFSSVPGFLLPGRHGVIRGHVFRDDASTAHYTGKETAVAGVEIQLDDNRTTHSDANGYYSFHHVPFGVHRVEAKFVSPEPFFYTTDSPAGVDMNGTADFGINFAKGQVFGFILNDGGKGVSAVTVELQGPNGVRTVQTGSDGKFRFLGLDPGDYSVRTLPESYPAGYDLQNLQTQPVTVVQGGPSKLNFTVRAFRSITGKVMAYDRTQLKPVPVPDMIVRVKELSVEARTGSNGAYVFRNLPSGVFTISVQYKGKETTRQVAVPADPANIRDMDLDVGPK